MARKKRASRKTAPADTSTTDPATQYALDVSEGRVIAGPHVRAACARHLRDLESGGERGLTWDIKAAMDALEYFPEVLRLSGGQFEGDAFTLEGWQAFIVGSIFGWKGQDGYRRFRVAYVETGKGSGKSPLAAGIGLRMLASDGEPRAEVYAAATKKDQARVLFRDAVAMVEQSPELASRLHMSGGQEKLNIAYLAKGSFFRPISTEERGLGQSGPRPHCGLLDEIHEHRTNAMVEFMRAGTKGRRQALMFMITNSGSDRTSVCWEYHNYAIKVAAGELEDDSFFGYVCALDDGEDPFTDRACWIKANPSLGVTFSEKYLEEQVRQARGMPSKQNLVRRLNFCIWTDAENAWISKDAWDSIEIEIDLEELTGRDCWGGLDLSAKLDLTAFLMVFEGQAGEFGLEEDGYLAVPVLWTPKDTLREREERDMVPYSVWVEQGHLRAPEGKTVQYRQVARDLGELLGQFRIQRVRYDRWRIDDLKRELDDEGVGLELDPHGQGYKDMSPAIDKLEELILEGRLRVAANPVLRWNAASAVLAEDPAKNRKFAKDKATGRIDGVVALAMAVAAATGESEGPSVYEERGIRAI